MTAYDELKNFYTGKKVLVTGHTGFKGSCLTVILGLMGARVYGYALKAATNPNLFDILYGTGVSSRHETNLRLRLPDKRSIDCPECVTESHIADIRDFEELEAYYEHVSPDVVIHLAAQPIVRESYRIPRETYEINVMGTVNLLECIRLHPDDCLSVLNVTTDKVYYNEERPGYAYRETDPLDGFDPYSNSKSCSELAAHCYACSFLEHTGTAVSTARAGNVIGGGDFSPDRIIPDCVRAVINGESIKVRNPQSVRPYQHVFDPLFAYLLIAMRQALDPSYSGWYNVGPDPVDIITTGELCDLFVNAYGGGSSWTAPGGSESLNPPHEAGLLILDNSRLREVFGWQPVWNIENAVCAVVSWTREWIKSPESANGELLKQISAFTGVI